MWEDRPQEARPEGPRDRALPRSPASSSHPMPGPCLLAPPPPGGQGAGEEGTALSIHLNCSSTKVRGTATWFLVKPELVCEGLQCSEQSFQREPRMQARAGGRRGTVLQRGAPTAAPSRQFSAPARPSPLSNGCGERLGLQHPLTSSAEPWPSESSLPAACVKPEETDSDCGKGGCK